jgi:threonine aldolase
MRFIAAPWVGLLENDVWLANARHANAMAQRLYAALADVPGVSVLHPAQANSVFATISPQAAAAMRTAGWRFYQFIGSGGCRFMCAWDTTPEAVDAFAADLRAVAA